MSIVGKTFKDFLDGTFKLKGSYFQLSTAESKAATLKKAGYLIHITTSKDPPLPSYLPRDRYPANYPRTYYDVWFRRKN